MLIDLHVHTTASDGQYDPSEIVRMAVEKGIEILTITDHDTVRGSAAAERYIGENKGEICVDPSQHKLRLISGIEISTQDTEEIHILYYKRDSRIAIY